MLGNKPIPAGFIDPDEVQAIKDDAVATAVAQAALEAGQILSRNGVAGPSAAINQTTATRTGMSSTTYTGNGTSQSVNTGVDMATGDLGGLVWVKRRSGVANHSLQDTVRGALQYIPSSAANAEITLANSVTSFDSTGFTVGSDNNHNQSAETYVAWSFQTNQKYAPTFGTELLTNSTFDTDTSGWTAGDAASQLTWDSGGIMRVTNGDTTGAWAYQAVSVTAGKKYALHTNRTGGTTASARVYVGTSAGSSDVLDPIAMDTNPHTQTTVFEATATTTYYVALDNTSTTSGHYVQYTEVSVKEITNDAYTNQGKPYTVHSNADMGFSIIGFEGNAISGHEIPHLLGAEPDLLIFKNRADAVNWQVSSSLFADDEYLDLNTTDALATTTGNPVIRSATTLSLGTGGITNGAADNMICYAFRSVPGVSKVGKYIGTGAAGNYVDCGFKPGFVLTKNLNTVSSWIIQDNARGDNYLLPDTSGAEASTVGTLDIDFVDTGFVVKDTGGAVNQLNDEILFLAFADSGSGPTTYEYPTTDDTVGVNQNTVLTFANGFDATSGLEVNTQEVVGSGITYTFGTGSENKHLWLYKDKAGSYGETEFRPLEGVTRDDADKYGRQSPTDSTTRIHAKHFDYESETGVVSASGFFDVRYPWQAFNEDTNENIVTGVVTAEWLVTSTTTSWLQYKHTEKRILKGWRLRGSGTGGGARTPDAFTIEGSNDGLNWTAIDSTWTAGGFAAGTSVGAGLWSELQDTSGNTTAYLYHRINITANNGDATYTGIAELEFNTILPSDYYLVNEGKMYNSSDVAIERIYLAEVRTGGTGDVTYLRNLTPGKVKAEDAEFQGDVTVHGEIKNRGVLTAFVNFDGTQNPPLIRDSYNVADVVDEGTGLFRVVFEIPMDSEAYAAVPAIGRKSSSLANRIATINEETVNSFLVRTTVATTDTASDNENNIVHVFGGKEIK